MGPSLVAWITVLERLVAGGVCGIPLRPCRGHRVGVGGLLLLEGGNLFGESGEVGLWFRGADIKEIEGQQGHNDKEQRRCSNKFSL